MYKIRILTTENHDFEHLHAIMYPLEDLCVSDQERRVRELIEFLEERQAEYEIIVEIKPGAFFHDYSFHRDPDECHYEIRIDDESTCVFLMLTFEEFTLVKIPDPEPEPKPEPIVEELIEELIEEPKPVVVQPKSSGWWPWSKSRGVS